MKKKLSKVAKDINKYLKSFIYKQKNSGLLTPMSYGLLPGGKKIRSKLLIDVGKIFRVKYQTLVVIGAAIECIHAYSLIHDDLPCMDNDVIRRGKLTTHKKFGESTAILAGNSLLTIGFEILSSSQLNIPSATKNQIINLISKCAGHSGVAGGQYLDLNYEKKRISKNKIIEMQRKKTGMLFQFCCSTPVILAKKNRYIKKFSNIGSDIGLLFQITDDLIDHQGITKNVGKKTRKDIKKGKATLISLLGYKNTINYSLKLKNKIFNQLNDFGKEAQDIKETLNYVILRKK
ncbi:MAG: polyprenyl synthetase family protein [Candidatus Pelagibacter sp. TMED118]|nr:MAG: polyprenyl synthetase family protein [Candidatus Pelagibacter sp. TMED118]RPG99858.1 MAG: polyprenyl synthetase family protein [Candidatus Pelagibacter sp. TMED118]|tara:strand:- start:1635 stop:2504 length:870 start_codon:yes stop_codon:yes gene_type:complete